MIFTLLLCCEAAALAPAQDALPAGAGLAEQDSLWSRPGQDWPGFLGPCRNGHSAETGLRFDWTERPPRLVWQYRVGEGYGSGSVADGRFYHFDRLRDQARLLCLHAETGQLLWQFEYDTDYRDLYGFDGGPRSSPLVEGGHVYIHGVEGMLHCLNARTGEPVWKLDTARRFGVIQNFFGAGSSPLVHGNRLIVMIGGSPPEAAALPPGQLDRVRPNGSGVVGFDKTSGEILYTSGDDLASYASPVIGELEGETVLLAMMRSGLHHFDPVSGESLGFFPHRARKLESVNASTPLLTAEGILITESYGPGGCLLPAARHISPDLEPRWSDAGQREKRLDCHWNTPVVLGDHAWASTGEKKSSAQLRCIRVRDGEIMWSEPGLTRSSLTAVDGHLICLTETGNLLALRADPREMDVVGKIDRAQLGTVEPCWAAPLVAHGYLYIRDRSRIYCLDIRQP